VEVGDEESMVGGGFLFLSILSCTFHVLGCSISCGIMLACQDRLANFYLFVHSLIHSFIYSLIHFVIAFFSLAARLEI